MFLSLSTLEFFLSFPFIHLLCFSFLHTAVTRPGDLLLPAHEVTTTDDRVLPKSTTTVARIEKDGQG